MAETRALPLPAPAATLCVGAAHWDLIARAEGPMPPGADRPGALDRRPGGVALNVALALAARGLPAALLAAVGRDPEGDALVAACAAAGVDCGPVLRLGGRTDAYVAIEAGGELVAGVADCRTLEAAGPALVAAIRALGPRPGAAVLDGNLPAPALDAVAAEGLLAAGPLYLAPASPAKAARLARFIAAAAPTIAANRAEAEALCGAPFAGAEPAARALVALGARRALVTDGPRPAALAAPGAAACRAPAALAPASVTGAGDAMLAALVAAERAGAADPDALLDAALAAAAAHIIREAP